MQHPKHLLLTLLCLCCSSFLLSAQQAITATGGEASGSGGTVSYSVGQIAYTTNSDLDYSEAQGVQQPFEISVVTNIVDLNGQKVQVRLFPNPTVDQLTLNIEGIATDQMTYELYDLQGKLLALKAINSAQIEILVDHLPAATYLLKIMKDQQAVTIFKILKH